uniref:Uncharacterized protein n=1 Tax=Arundo donax TaxID=35708 RepID=A0A0A8ZDQ8_ARUDO
MLPFFRIIKHDITDMQHARLQAKFQQPLSTISTKIV